MDLPIRFSPSTGSGLAKLRLALTDAANNQVNVDVSDTKLRTATQQTDGSYLYVVQGLSGLAAGTCQVVAQSLDANEQPLGAAESFMFEVPLSEGGFIPDVISIG
jgi:hypothetical protein